MVNVNNLKYNTDIVLVRFANFKHISPPFPSVSIVNFKQVNVCWDKIYFTIMVNFSVKSQISNHCISENRKK